MRNIALRSRPDDIRNVFEKFGEVRDVYLPMNFYTKELKGFCFVEFVQRQDAEDAVEKLNNTVLGGRSIIVEFAKVRPRVRAPP